MRLEDIGNEVVDFPQKFVGIEPRVARGELAENPVRFNNVRKISQLTKFDPLFKEYSRHPRILDVVTSLIGPDLKIFLDQTLCKPARVGSAKPPHQDSAYWTRIDPPDIVTCWMALDDSRKGTAVCRFIPGSHKKGVIEQQAPGRYRVKIRISNTRTKSPLP